MTIIAVFQLRAYANIQPKGSNLDKKLLYLDVNFKAYVLCESAVKSYSGQIPKYCEEYTGMVILKFIYIVGFVAVLLFVPVLVILLSKNIHLTLKDKWSRSSSIIAGGTIVSFTFVLLSMFAELNQISWLVSPSNNNFFAHVKLAFMLITFIWSILFTAGFVCIWKSKCANISNKVILFTFTSVASIVTFASHLGLIVFPTVIYLFIHPINTMSLIFLHISIIYSMTIIVGILFYYIHQWSTWEIKLKHKYCCEVTVWSFILFYICCMFGGVILGYFTIIEFYQLVINRNLYDQFAWTSITNNIPALVMVFFAWILNKEFFKRE